MPELILCTGPSVRAYNIAQTYGFKYGTYLPCAIRGPLHFADQDWKNPKRKRYVEAISMTNPIMATVLDLEQENQFNEVLGWAEEISIFVKESIVIIPKVNEIIKRLPKYIGGKRIVLGYSVYSLYGTTTVPLEEFKRWPIHLLGGCPFRQKTIYRQFINQGNEIVSIDSNYMQKMATKHCQFFELSGFPNHWPTLKEADGKRFDGHGPEEALIRSCEAYLKWWSNDI